MFFFEQNGQKFTKYPSERYATEVTFQLANRLSGNMQEGKVNFSGKHIGYGFKVEVSVLPTGIALGCSKHYQGY